MLGAKGFLTFWPRYLTYSKKRTLLHLWNAASVFLLFSYILFSNHNFTSFLPHPLFWHTHTARFRWSVPSLPLLSFELSQSHKAGRTWTCILCLILYEKFAVRSTNMKHFSAQVLPGQSGYSQSASLLAHNRIAASQLIRSGLYHSWYKQVPTHCLLLCAIEAGDLLDSVKK